MPYPGILNLDLISDFTILTPEAFKLELQLLQFLIQFYHRVLKFHLSISRPLFQLPQFLLSKRLQNLSF